LTPGLNYGSLCEWSSGETGRGVGEGVQTGAGRQRKCAGNRKKILNRGNEPKNVFKAKELAFLGAKNELVFQCQKTQSKRKIGANKYDSETGNWKIEAGNTHLGLPSRAAKNKLHPAGRLDILRAIQIKEANQGNHRDQSRPPNQEEL
jgi:hypothetical protein